MKPYISAYPQPFTKDDSGNFHQPMDKNEWGSGMSLLDYFAGQALVGLMQLKVTDNIRADIAYKVAEEMLTARERINKPEA